METMQFRMVAREVIVAEGVIQERADYPVAVRFILWQPCHLTQGFTLDKISTEIWLRIADLG